MDDQLRAVGERIRAQLVAESMTQAQLAGRVQMDPGALSRALNGRRGFSLSELIRIADELHLDLTWLMTGTPGAHRRTFAARQGWDENTRTRSNPGLAGDEPTLEKIVDLYLHAYPEGSPSTPEMAANVDDLRHILGTGFVRDFADRVEDRLKVDVIRVPDVSTDYSMRIGDRAVIVLTDTPNWFRSNFSLAHELGHLALGHHLGPHGDTGSHDQREERAADRFAADMLMPESLVIENDLRTMTEQGVADLLWTLGVSTKALAVRLDSLHVSRGEAVEYALAMPTTSLLRLYGRPRISPVDIAVRQQTSSARRFPAQLLADLTARVGDGQAPPQPLAWAWDSPLDEIDFPEPADESAVAAEYERAMSDRTGLDALLAGVLAR